jgi:HEAT repeat protein
MFKTKLTLALAAALLAGLASSHAQPPTPLLTKRTEAQLIAVLKSDAPLKAKVDACRELGIIGTKEAVPVLAAMLPDEQLNHAARYALEPNPDPSVNEVLRAALGTLKGRPLVGVINSLGVRKDAQATDALAALLPNGDADVAQAAARSLGKIGSAPAARAITGALAAAPAGNQLAFYEGLFRCAETLLANGQRDEALAIYDKLRAVKEPHQVRAGGWRGAIVARGKDGLPLLVEAFGSDDWIVVAAAARAAMETPAPEFTAALTAELGKGSVDKQVLVVQVLGKRHDAAALPALSTASKSGEKAVRLASIRALGELQQPSAAPVLIDLLGDTERDLAQAAQESLAALPGKEIDAAIMAMLAGTDANKRLVAIDLMARRRMTSAVPTLLKASADNDPKVRAAAVKRAGELATVNELPALLDFLQQAKNQQDLEVAEQAVNGVCTKASEPESCVDKLTAMMPQAQPAQKCAVVRVLGSIGGAKALAAVRAAVDEGNPEVHAVAIRALGDWKTAEAGPDLLRLAKAATDPKDKTLCLRSFLGLARNTDLPADQRLAICRDAAGLVQQTEEKKLLLGALGGVQSADSVALIAPYLKDTATKEEASAAVVSIADKLLKGKDAAKVAGKLIDPLQQASQATGNADLAKRAGTLLQQAQSKAGAK